eukprot:TRINITY_DN19025_c0_g1_i1.p1 TRINITY_DN19025_c0_g1~~TRINITY_DN19025_c0_g1_i1.p1  ORF type:complete len:660 (+),score=112.40 TRINITY_DN19025_c0_g1_i1:90-1982(+)
MSAAGASIFSEDSEAPQKLVTGTDSEFERLLEDSVDVDCGLLPGAAASPLRCSQVLSPEKSPRASAFETMRPLQPQAPEVEPVITAAVEAPAVRAAASDFTAAVEAPAVRAVASDFPATRCRNCGNVYMADARFCRHCGQKRPLPSTEAALSCEMAGAAKASDEKEAWAMMQLSGRLEDICRDLRRSVEHEFLLSERSLVARHQAELEAQRLKAETAALEQQARIESLERELASQSRKIDARGKQVKDALGLMQSTRRRLAGRFFLESSWRAWRHEAASGKDQRLQQLVAEKLSSKRSLGRLFGVWRHHSQACWRERLIAHERAAADTVRAKLFEQMESERNQLLTEAEELRKQLQEEARQRALLQDNLKRVFMRGVCALNFEAMSLLNDPSGAGQDAAPALATSAAALASASAAPLHEAATPLPTDRRFAESGGAVEIGDGSAVLAPPVVSSFEQLLARPSAAPSTATGGSLFDRIDRNGDGVISREEFADAMVGEESQARAPPLPVPAMEEETQLPDEAASASFAASCCPSCCSVYMADAKFCRHCGRKREFEGAGPGSGSAPLPFVSYTGAVGGPAGSAASSALLQTPAANSRQTLPKSQRWQTATSPGMARRAVTPALARREVAAR